MQLSEDQEKALDFVIKWAKDDTQERCMMLAGHAGTGKTTVVLEAVRHLRDEMQCCLTAPTNKATKVLADIARAQGIKVDCMTAYASHGLRLASDDVEEYVVKSRADITPVSAFGLIVADEASMINEQLFREFTDAADAFRLKVLFVGDPWQLPPVKAATSLAFGLPTKFEMTRIVRQAEGNSIIAAGDWCRRMARGETDARFPEFSPPGQPGLHSVSYREFMDRFVQSAVAVTKDGRPGAVRGVAWRNDRVDGMVQAVRAELYGRSPPPFVVGERIFMKKPFGSLKTDYEATVQSVDETCGHPEYPEWQVVPMALKPDGSEAHSAYAVHPGILGRFESYLDESRFELIQLQGSAQKNWRKVISDGVQPVEASLAGLREDGRTYDIRRGWVEYHAFRKAFAQLKSVHAITTHRSQGSTFDEVYVDALDIRDSEMRGGPEFRYRLLYVAITRARTHAWIRA